MFAVYILLSCYCCLAAYFSLKLKEQMLISSKTIFTNYLMLMFTKKFLRIMSSCMEVIL